MVGKGPETRYSREETFDVFQQLEPPGTPLSTTEVADELGCDRGTAVENLEGLAGEDVLETRKVDGDDRLWWRRGGHNQSVGQDAQPGLDQAQFDELVRVVTDYAIFVLDPDGRVQTWNEGARQIKGYRKDEIVGEHFSTFYTEADREAGRPERNLRMAAEQGRIEDEGERVRKDGSTFWANVTITALHDDGDELRGFAKVTRDMTERHQYEQTIENERERLEFMNRIVRHNVLNGLNLVNARTEVLETMLADDHEAQEHIETILTRIDDLASLIDTMREFMDAVVSDADQDVEPIAIRDELDSKLALARESYPDADFEAYDLPDPSTRVAADELIGEMFENVLSNAVLHNDKETPRIEVWSSGTTHEAPLDSETGAFLPDQRTDLSGSGVEVRECPAVAIQIADNGPGIPDDEKESILEKGVSGLQAPGNGFGLYLVNEMMDAYGGSVNVRDRCEDGDGVVFELVFHRLTDDESA